MSSFASLIAVTDPLAKKGRPFLTALSILKHGQRGISIETLNFPRQFGHSLKQISDQPDIGHLKNRGVFILVDRDDGL